MKKHKITFTSLLFSILLILNSCDVQWFGDYKEDLEESLSSNYKFYSNSSEENFVTKQYKVFSSISPSNFPKGEDFKQFSDYKPGYYINNWKYVRTSETKSTEKPSAISTDGQNNVRSVQVDLYSFEFYATWAPRPDTPYTVKHFFQTASRDSYISDESLTQVLQGTTDTLTNATAYTIQGYDSLPVTQVNINGDGSAFVVIYYDRSIINIDKITFNTGLVTGETDIFNKTGYYGSVVDVTIPDLSASGLYFKGWNITYADGNTGTIPGFTLTYPNKNVLEAAAIWGELNSNDIITITFDPEKDAEIDISGTYYDDLNKKIVLSATITGLAPNTTDPYKWYLDGVIVSTGKDDMISAAGVSAGYHHLLFVFKDNNQSFYSASATVQCTGSIQ